jgi:hypothetical protein
LLLLAGTESCGMAAKAVAPVDIDAEQRALNALLFRASKEGHNVVGLIERNADPRSV